MGIWGVDDGRSYNTKLNAAATDGSANVKGGYTQIVAATPFDTTSIALAARTGGNVANCLLDLAVGAAAAEQVLIPNFYCASDTTSDVVEPRIAAIPVSIPKGTRLSVAGQDNVGSKTPSLYVELYGGGLRSPRPFGAVTTLGADTANSRGTAITMASASWVQLTAALTRSLRGFFVCLGSNASLSDVGCIITLAVGAAGSEVIFWQSADVIFRPSSGTGFTYGFGYMPCVIPAGTRIACKVSGATGATIYIVVYGVS